MKTKRPEPISFRLLLRRMVLPGAFVGILFLVVLLRHPRESADRREWLFSGPTMGTVYNVKVVARDLSEVEKERIHQAIRSALTDVDKTMSTYREDSELSRFNRHGVDPFPASPDLLEVMAEANRISRITHGAFDITVGPLVDAWGFGPDGRSEPPSDEVIEELLASTGFEQVTVDLETGILQKTRGAVRCDLSAIAKGFGVDHVAIALEGIGYRDYMVEIGGEIRTSGRNAANDRWRIGLELPEATARDVYRAFPLVDAAMATSGDYRNYYEVDGVRVSHTIDPKTGRPITHNLASVTVVHPSCMTADGLATGLNVLGPIDGLELAEAEKIAAFFLVREPEGGYSERQSTAFRGLMGSWNEEATEP